MLLPFGFIICPFESSTIVAHQIAVRSHIISINNVASTVSIANNVRTCLMLVAWRQRSLMDK